jgi:hypothetical protein
MESVGKVAKGEWSGVLVRHDAIGPLEVEIVWPPEFKAASDDARLALMETINLGLPGRWRADSWDGESRKVHLTRRPKLERFIPNPGLAGRVAWHLIPLGRDEAGNVVSSTRTASRTHFSSAPLAEGSPVASARSSSR